ncbi:MAG: hypothetical protein GXO22_06905 [Aquificae bacterium]|nr:hypothetical protein [Aquificota bacterium]
MKIKYLAYISLSLMFMYTVATIHHLVFFRKIEIEFFIFPLLSAVIFSTVIILLLKQYEQLKERELRIKKLNENLKREIHQKKYRARKHRDNNNRNL